MGTYAAMQQQTSITARLLPTKEVKRPFSVSIFIIYIYIYVHIQAALSKGKRKGRRFSLKSVYRLLIMQTEICHFSFVRLLMKKQTEVIRRL
jgi:hypothetical protein